MKSICGADCEKCSRNTECKGCVETNGCPFGKHCFIAGLIQQSGEEAFEGFKKELIDAFNDLGIPGMPKINKLYALNGEFVNLSYPIPGGKTVRLLDDHAIYLGNQVERDDGVAGRCYGLVAGPEFLLVSEYGVNGSDPEIVIYRRNENFGGTK